MIYRLSSSNILKYDIHGPHSALSNRDRRHRQDRRHYATSPRSEALTADERWLLWFSVERNAAADRL